MQIKTLISTCAVALSLIGCMASAAQADILTADSQTAFDQQSATILNGHVTSAATNAGTQIHCGENRTDMMVCPDISLEIDVNVLNDGDYGVIAIESD